MMTQIQILDRLAGKRVSRIDFKNGAPLVCPTPALADFTDSNTPAEMWIEVTENGLLLHFNAETYPGSGKHVQTEPLSNIAYVS